MNDGSHHRKVVLANPNGLHMRPSAAFAELAGRFQCEVLVHYEDKTVNGKSVFDLMLLIALPGSELTIETCGPDAREALEELASLLASVPADV